MEDTIGQTRIKNFIKVDSRHPLHKRETYMISLRKKRKVKMFMQRREEMIDSHQTQEEKEFLKSHKIQDNILGFENTFEVLRCLKATNPDDLKDIHLYLTLLSEYVSEFSKDSKEFPQLFEKVGFEEVFGYCVELIDMIDKSEHIDQFYDIFDKILDFSTTLCEESEDFKDQLFYCRDFVPVTCNIYKWLAKFWSDEFVQKEDLGKAEEGLNSLYNKTTRSLVKLQVLFTYLSMDIVRLEILLKDGDYLKIISNLFMVNRNLKSKKVWFYSCSSLIFLCQYVESKINIEEYEDILESIAFELTSQGEMTEMNMQSLEVVLLILKQYKQEADLKEAVSFVKFKINVIMNICYDFYSELAMVYEDCGPFQMNDTQKQITEITLEIMTIFVENDSDSHLEAITSDDVFFGILEATDQCKEKEKLFSFLACVIQRYSWECGNEICSKTFTTQPHRAPIALIIGNGIIKDNYNKVLESSTEMEKTEFIRLLKELFIYANQVENIDRALIDIGFFSSCTNKEANLQYAPRSEEPIKCIFSDLIPIIESRKAPKLLISSLHLLHSLLCFGQRRTKDGEENPLAVDFTEKGGTDALENLLEDPNQGIAKICEEILYLYFRSK
ncbi:unnamed protein product [Moneuplotes crassus]|uniref:Uncharacterized protein n=1 Tax=Euplotes crassus TaxID=5936 RepID=A0AAD1U3F9_EUPCR|nr:unnamed protein product [Moneuplotes crassus]